MDGVYPKRFGKMTGKNRVAIAQRIWTLAKILMGESEFQTQNSLVKKTGWAKSTVQNYLKTMEIIEPHRFQKKIRKGTGVKNWYYVYWIEV